MEMRDVSLNRLLMVALAISAIGIGVVLVYSNLRANGIKQYGVTYCDSTVKDTLETIRLYNFADCSYGSVNDLAEWLKVVVIHNPSNGADTIVRGDRTITFSLSNEVMEVNIGFIKKYLQLSGHCMLIGDSIYAPVDQFVYSLGGKVTQGKNGIVTGISFNGREAKLKVISLANFAPQIKGRHLLLNGYNEFLIGGIDNHEWKNDKDVGVNIAPFNATIFDNDGIIGDARIIVEKQEDGYYIPVGIKGEKANPNRFADSKSSFGIENLTWNPIPERPVVVKQNDRHIQIVKATLNSIVVECKSVTIGEIISADIDADGIPEEVMSVSNRIYSSSGTSGYDVDCSLIMYCKPGDNMAKIITGEWNARKIEGVLQDVSIGEFSIAGIFDIDGDGKLELIIDAPYLGGNKMRVYRFWNGSFIPLISTVSGVSMAEVVRGDDGKDRY